MAPNGTPVYHDAADGFKPKIAKIPCFLRFFCISRIRNYHLKYFTCEMVPAGRDARRIPPGRPAGGPSRRPSGPTGRAGRPPAAAAAMPFSLTLPASPPGTGGGQNTKPAAYSRPTTFALRAASPPDESLGAERPGTAGTMPAELRPGWPGPSTADLAAGMTPLAAAGRLLERAGTEWRDPRRPPGRRPGRRATWPRQRVLSAPTETTGGREASQGRSADRSDRAVALIGLRLRWAGGIVSNAPRSSAIAGDQIVALVVAGGIRSGRAGGPARWPRGGPERSGSGQSGRPGGVAGEVPGIGSNSDRGAPLHDGHRRSGWLGSPPRRLGSCSELGIEVVCGRTSPTFRGVSSPPTTTAIDE
jgi:hypothetical protein